jgi:hypothetical protein
VAVEDSLPLFDQAQKNGPAPLGAGPFFSEADLKPN